MNTGGGLLHMLGRKNIKFKTLQYKPALVQFVQILRFTYALEIQL